jgi:peptide subunit release factor RF-3
LKNYHDGKAAVGALSTRRRASNGTSNSVRFRSHGTRRGISISSTVMNFDYVGLRFIILDTRAQDFPKILTAPRLGRNRITSFMLQVEPGNASHLKYKFINKMDHSALTPYSEIMDQVEEPDLVSRDTHPIM